MHGEPWPVDNLDASDSEDDADSWMPNPSDANSGVNLFSSRVCLSE